MNDESRLNLAVVRKGFIRSLYSLPGLTIMLGFFTLGGKGPLQQETNFKSGIKLSLNGEVVVKIAILVREETTNRCTGKGCLKSFFAKTESFARYRGMEAELIGFFHGGGDIDYKLMKMKEAGVEVIHVSTCMRGRCEGYEELVKKIAKDFDVIGYSHGSENGKTVKTVSITGKYS